MGKYSCSTAAETLEWIRAIIDFLRPYSSLLHAHVVNFFKDRLWESLDSEWINCLKDESVENLANLPSGLVQDYWPSSLKEFILALRSLVFPRAPAELQKVFHNIHIKSIDKVLTQGMNSKKKHEIEILATVVDYIARSVGSHTVVDVGAGQGYLAQVLSFQHELSVIAIDACSHHGGVTNARAERIKKHYTAVKQKSVLGNRNFHMPKIVTCRVLNTDTLRGLTNPSKPDNIEEPRFLGQDLAELTHEGHSERNQSSLCFTNNKVPLVLAGLHACGDLSVTMLRTFLECKEIKAVISIGCCYNLLTEAELEDVNSQCGFPLSRGVKSTGFSLGKSSRDLACQSAERWKCLGNDAALHNFDLHAFRAAFQMVLFEYFPEVLESNPSIGRQGKALRRQQQRRIIESPLCSGSCTSPWSSDWKNSKMNESPNDKCGLASDIDTSMTFSHHSGGKDEAKTVDKYSAFMKFCQNGLSRLDIKSLHDNDFLTIWKKVEPFTGLVGPYWSIRAALGPLLETFLLLDRLLFLQEQGDALEALMLPLFDPVLSPRNMVIFARKT
ncbi:Methyltransferase domain [Dillenia turbinata]|uniref:Methyltransferase domain n=1 Tax=Dillenia turbinata TaxID=194707 RepID=A0AAN8ZUF2_9MAGN